jgi:hypothetical protein
VPGVDLTTLGHWELDPRILDRIDHAAADALIAEVAKEALLTDPVGYLTFTFELVWRNLTSHSTGWLLHIADHEVNDALLALQTEPLLRYSAGAGTWAEYLRLAHVPIWLALCGLAVSSVVVLPWMPRGLLIGAFLWSMFGYMLACSAIEFASHRYNACITPFVSALAVVPLAAIDHALRRRRESAQTSAQPPTMSAVV